MYTLTSRLTTEEYTFNKMDEHYYKISMELYLRNNISDVWNIYFIECSFSTIGHLLLCCLLYKLKWLRFILLNTPCKILHANSFSICLLVVYSFCILNNNIIPAWSPQRYANQLRLTTWKILESSFHFSLSLSLSLNSSFYGQ